ncbi:uncharacterized protein PADG_07555 [Paracoccidioides brasiliensis Pb18]|uniref:Uncharacterized protein n=1 Tax=Paracoccidioides brasiliensis (strain Pb18) TaxID=502780 RepID=C1GJW9_PARBD|nr:uncharacterized protein PADG_07555 [Paracoccidioides brasiliensis Pb18]EEH42735.1 hypothetical protein PADG_07555 [Paracoccidioides brasiliensis Pb18]ODH52788.1 hypothetical protein GX48_00982 [Paracoccidioides brasiliensis]
MLKFPENRNDWSLDIVSLLAVIGESAMSAHSQPLTASILCLLPRILPAPQALLRHARPTRLPSIPAHIVSIHSGTLLVELNHFANLIYNINLPSFSVHEIRIKHREGYEDTLHDEKKLRNRIFRTPKGVIHARPFSPLFFLSVASFLLSVGLCAWAVLLEDGVAVIAIVVVSIASSIIGLSSMWHPNLTVRKRKTVVPDGDLVIRTRQGAFVIIRCTEEVARELYTGTEECSYVVGDQVFRALVGVGTFLLMSAVILMGNATWTMQAALGCSYVLLNGCYQIAALFPMRWHWNLVRYDLEEIKQLQAQTYTQALWNAIRVSQFTNWVRVSHAAPNSESWRAWIDLAGDNIHSPKWDAQKVLDQLLNAEKSEAGFQPATDVFTTEESCSCKGND